MIGIISQARMTSTRLPGKILKEIKGKSLLQLHIDRLKWSRFPVFIATTVNQADDVVEDLCRKNQIQCFRGDEHHVLSRYYGLALKYKLKTIIRVTSDCPLIDGYVVKAGVEKYMQGSSSVNRYLTNCQQRTYPRGFDFEVFSFEALQRMFDQATEDYEKEHVTPFIWKTHPEDFEIMHFKRQANDSQYRITVDEPDDFKLIEKLILDYNCDQKVCEEIIYILRNHPELYAINSHVEQKKV